MKHFVVHWPKLADRKEFLKGQLAQHGITDVEWVEDTPGNADGPFIKWLHQRTKATMAPGFLACSAKHYWILNEMVRRNIPKAIILEDDAVLHESYGRMKIPEDLDFVKLGMGVNWYMNPGPDPISIGNFGCSEAQYVTLKFAKELVQNLNFGHCADIVYWAHLLHTGRPLVCIPVCHQTSLLEGSSSTGGEHPGAPSLGRFIQLWPELPKFSWPDLMAEYQERATVEAEFEANFGKKLDITNAEYIMVRARQIAAARQSSGN
jgi:hypothetical protein